MMAASGRDVVLQDLDLGMLAKARKEIGDQLAFLQRRDRLPIGTPESALAKVRLTVHLEQAVETADFIQESVFDAYPLKKRVFKAIDAAAKPAAIIASSSSGLLMSEIQKGLDHPERCVLAHPCLPVHLIPLVEVVGGRQTAAATVEGTCDFMKAIGKTPVVLRKEVPGFIVNRFQAALLREAIDLVHQGVASAEEVDKAFRLGIGLRDPLLGPLMRVHLAGDGIERFVENYADSYRVRWSSMASWQTLPPAAAKAVIESVRAMKSVRGHALPEIKRWRDRMLVKILDLVAEEGEMR
jgi:3-hydroxypropionate dehydrogenase (NADP+)